MVHAAIRNACQCRVALICRALCNLCHWLTTKDIHSNSWLLKSVDSAGECNKTACLLGEAAAVVMPRAGCCTRQGAFLLKLRSAMTLHGATSAEMRVRDRVSAGSAFLAYGHNSDNRSQGAANLILLNSHSYGGASTMQNSSTCHVQFVFQMLTMRRRMLPMSCCV